MAITGIRSFHYNTNKPELAKNFYIKAFGFQLDYESPGWIALKMDGVQVALHPENTPVAKIPCDDHGAHAGGCLTLESNDIKADRIRLQSLGAEILAESDEPWGHMLTFKDLDGNFLKLMNPKY